MKYVPFDHDWFAIGFIEPEFVEEVYGWANEEILINAGMISVMEFGQDTPVAWVPDAFTKVALPEPKPLIRTELKWRWIDNT